MEIIEQTHGAVMVLKPVGPLVEDGADAFRKHALAAATNNLGRVVVDATAIAFLDGRGIECLVDVTEQMAESGAQLKLCGMNTTVQQALDLTGWSEAFESFDNVNAAVRSFM